MRQVHVLEDAGNGRGFEGVRERFRGWGQRGMRGRCKVTVREGEHLSGIQESFSELHVSLCGCSSSHLF